MRRVQGEDDLIEAVRRRKNGFLRLFDRKIFGGDDDLIPTSPLGGLRATMTDDGEIVVDEVIDDEIPVAGAVEEEEEDQGYVLEEDDEEAAEEEEEDEGPLAHSTDDDY